MARLEDVAYAPITWTVVAQQTNDVCTAQKPAELGRRHWIAGVTVSASGAPLTNVLVQLNDDSTVWDQWEIPPAAFAPLVYNYARPYRGGVNAPANITVGAMGAGVRATVVLRGFTTLE